MSKVLCLIMAGGKGTRLWPESTSSKPKQYLGLGSEQSLLEQTINRFSKSVKLEDRYIVTTKEQEALAKENSKGLMQDSGFIFEPSGRNTAPCILLSLAAMEKAGANDEDIIAVMPSDHIILDTAGFTKTFEGAVSLSRETDSITTIGITPHFPHTGYGYIKKSDEISNGFKVEQFVEKPNFETAKEYLTSGNYLWNAGMFMASLGVFKREFASHAPEMFEFYAKLLEAIGDEKAVAEVYAQIPKDSVDYAIMEKSNTVTTVPASFDWNDLGSWEALENVIEKTDGNTIVEAGEHFFKDATGNIVFAPNKFVSLINVENLVIVENDKSLMVMPKEDAQRVREIVAHLKEQGKTDLL